MGLFDRFHSDSPEDQFAKAVLDALMRRRPDGRFKYRRKHFILEWGRSGQGVGLRPYFRRWRSMPESERSRLVDLIAASSFRPKPDFSFDEAAIHLTPIVRRRHVRRDGQAYPPEDVPTRDVCGLIFAMLIIDAPGCRKMVSDGELRAWGKSFDEAFEIGLENLRSYSTEPFDFGSHVGMLMYPDGYDSGRILFTDLFANLPYRGAPVAILIDPARVILTGSESQEGLEALSQGAELAFRNCPKPISPAPIILENGAWRMLGPNDDGFELFSNLIAYDQEMAASNNWD